MAATFHSTRQKREHLGTDSTVPQIDFAAWLKQEGFSIDDFIRVKVDIKGCEFGLFKALLAPCGGIELIDELQLEHHGRKFGEARAKKLHDDLQQRGLLFHSWTPGVWNWRDLNSWARPPPAMLNDSVILEGRYDAQYSRTTSRRQPQSGDPIAGRCLGQTCVYIALASGDTQVSASKVAAGPYPGGR
jgi:hypothetical protein